MADVRAPRFVIWLTLIFVLLGVLLYHWQQVDKEAENTAFSVVVGQMTERANNYRQQWLVNKQPSSMKVAEQLVHFDANGWVMPIHNNLVDCDWWLRTLYPNVGRGYVDVPSSRLISNGVSYECRYQFESKKNLVLSLSDKNLSIGVEK